MNVRRSRTPEGAPGFGGVLGPREQRPRRGLIAGGAVAIVVMATSLAGQLGSSDGEQMRAPATIASATESIAPTPTAMIERPDPAYTWSDTPPRVVLRTPERDVLLRTWLGCWTGPSGNGRCVEEEPEPLSELPDVGTLDDVEFWFGAKGWTFDATFTELGRDCPRSEDARSVPIAARWFRLDPAGFAGDYRVDLSGHGPNSGIKGVPTMMSFVWHTPADGPVDQPNAHVSDASLELSDLGFQPASSAAQVTVTDANGKTTVRQLPPGPGAADYCAMSALGGLYFEGDFIDPTIPELGPSPYRYRVRLTLDGKTYVGTATSKAGAYVDPRGAGPGTGTHDVDWSPPLPAYTG